MSKMNDLATVLDEMRPLARPHGISPEPFLVHPLDLRHRVTVAFWTLLSIASLSA